MKKWSLLIITYACCTLALFGTQNESERVEVGPRKKQTKVAEEATQKCVAPSYNQRPSQSFAYLIKEIGVNGKTITLHDESIWEVSHNSAYTSKYWMPNSHVVIKPNKSWFSSYDYILYNIDHQDSITVNLSQGPFQKHGVFIQYIEPCSRYIHLSNGTGWNVSNYKEFRDWREGQFVFIGENDSWWGPKYILLNINENTYLPASKQR